MSSTRESGDSAVRTPVTTVRSVRAACEYIAPVEIAPGVYDVHTDAGDVYTVDIEGPACTCADFEYRAGTEFDVVDGCKHIRRCRMLRGEIDLGPLLESDARVNPILCKRLGIDGSYAAAGNRGGRA